MATTIAVTVNGKPWQKWNYVNHQNELLMSKSLNSTINNSKHWSWLEPKLSQQLTNWSNCLITFDTRSKTALTQDCSCLLIISFHVSMLCSWYLKLILRIWTWLYKDTFVNKPIQWNCLIFCKRHNFCSYIRHCKQEWNYLVRWCHAQLLHYIVVNLFHKFSHWWIV